MQVWGGRKSRSIRRVGGAAGVYIGKTVTGSVSVTSSQQVHGKSPSPDSEKEPKLPGDSARLQIYLLLRQEF
jgi:hypothetical protein